MDFWTSENSYESFREHYSAEYRKIDVMCEAMTDSESETGRFERR
jgi:hypothetical protein